MRLTASRCERGKLRVLVTGQLGPIVLKEPRGNRQTLPFGGQCERDWTFCLSVTLHATEDRAVMTYLVPGNTRQRILYT